ncbi:MAG: ATP-binding protein [Polyangiaceae bacterium]|nr:ATP-binding protein [Polyangiaceae bacterium]
MLRPRVYDQMLSEHLQSHRQMAFVSGPRQVGKTTACRGLASCYLSWGKADHRRILQQGASAVAACAGVEQAGVPRPSLAFDELTDNPRWKSLLKGLFDSYADKVRLLVTGRSLLDESRRGGDSLGGRYLAYRMHPFSVRECVDTAIYDDPIGPPRPMAEDDWQALVQHGGFPEPFLKRNEEFSARWRSRRRDRLVKKELREVAQGQELRTLQALAQRLAERSAERLSYLVLSDQMGAPADALRRSVDLLERLYLGFLVRPWSPNATKAPRKEPKWFLRDWSSLDDPEARAKTFVGCHLLKAVEGWTDLGFGQFELGYLRDRAKREVDFLVLRDGKPWFLVDVTTRETKLSETLARLQQQSHASHAFQVVMDLPFTETSCFVRSEPTVVSTRTLLSQLL